MEALRAAEQRRLDYSVSKGILQIWLATYALLGLSVLLLCCWRLSVAFAYLCAMLVRSLRFGWKDLVQSLEEKKPCFFERFWKGNVR